MADPEQHQTSLSPSARFSYYFIVGTIVLIAWLQLAGPLLIAFFTFLALASLQLPVRGGRWLSLFSVLIVIAALGYGLIYFVHSLIEALPEIGDKAIPAIISWAKEYGIQLPFTDYDSLKDFALDTIKGEARYLNNFAKFARGASSHLLFLAVGAVVAMSCFLNPRFVQPRQGGGDDNLYVSVTGEIATRFKTLYESFSTVMGAQIVISAINTTLSAIFLLAVGLPYAVIVIGVTFLCGLVPIVGNLISNSIVVAIGFTVSPRMALGALIFLVVIHKLEYLLNSQVVGWRTRNPFWLTLLALMLGERIFGVAGMILGPVLLNYIRLEASRFKGVEAPEKRASTSPPARPS